MPIPVAVMIPLQVQSIKEQNILVRMDFLNSSDM